METTLNFIEQYTTEQFKAQHAVAHINMCNNTTSGKTFFSYGNRTGAVTSKGITGKPVVSLVNETLDRMPTIEEQFYIGKTVTMKTADGKSEKISHPKANGFFYMLHDEGTSDAITIVATF